MLPMGTIMTAAMFLGVLFLGPLYTAGLIPSFLKKTAGVLVLVAGAWNVFWYALQHLTEFWGLAAMGSGLCMLLAGYVLLKPQHGMLSRARWLIVILLLGFAFLYARTIASL